MKASVVAACLAVLMCAGAASAGNMFGEEENFGVADVFNAYLAAHGKSYSESEWGERMQVFYDNLKTIDELNAANGSPAFGVNQFTDMHPKEFRSMYLNYRPHETKPDMDGVYEPSALSRAAEIPSSMDWRNKGVITPVKNQAQCGSCWAFSTTEEIESRWAQAGHKLEELSVQQIVSCDNVDQGCNGGDTITAYQYVMQAGGLESQAEYPYTSGGGDNGVCKFNKKDIVANITGFKWATKNSDENVMKHFIGTTGPLSTCVDASTWQFYTGGVISSGCGRQLDHCVQTVGYNSNGGTDYWIVRNSWTTSWGENGYLYIEIGKDLCGIADEPTYVECPK